MSGSATNEICMNDRLDADFLQGLFHSVGLAIVACEPDGRIVACNIAARALFGSAETCARRHVSTLFPPADREAITALIAKCAANVEPCEYQTQLGSDQAGPLEYAALCTPVLADDGSLRGLSLWLRDITKRRRLQRQFKKNERLAYLGKLSGAVAHHYNNMLCSIATSLEYAMNMNTMSAMRRAAQRTAAAVARATDVTRQLLAFAQADHRTSERRELAELVTEFFQEHAERLRNRHVELQLDLQPIPSLTLPRKQFRIVLAQLVDNALDVMPAGGLLKVDLGLLGPDIICLSIADTGGGISAEDMEHLFEPFHTSKGVLAAGHTTNAGLGLAVVYGLVSEMRGAITAANSPGQGARFDIVFAVDRGEDQDHDPVDNP